MNSATSIVVIVTSDARGKYSAADKPPVWNPNCLPHVTHSTSDGSESDYIAANSFPAFGSYALTDTSSAPATNTSTSTGSTPKSTSPVCSAIPS